MGELSQLLKRSALAGLICILTLTWGACGDSETTAPEASKESLLLESGITALWAEGKVGEIESVQVRSTYRQHADDIGENLNSIIEPHENRYREDRVSRGLILTQASNSKTAWASLDGTQIPIPEKERALLSLPPFLLRVSLLESLRDQEQFELKAQGEVTLANQLRATRMEVTPIGDLAPGNLTITLDFGIKDHLVRRVELSSDTSGQSSHVLFLDDYRPTAINGQEDCHMMVAFRLTAYRGEVLMGFETVDHVVFNDSPVGAFVAQPDPAADTTAPKPCVSGRVAFVTLAEKETSTSDIAAAADDLKSWIQSSKLKTAGPLVHVHDLSAEKNTESRVRKIFIPIAAGGDLPKPHSRFGIENAAEGSALCRTLVGKMNIPETITELSQLARSMSRTVGRFAHEIHFTPTGSTCQVQLLLED